MDYLLSFNHTKKSWAVLFPSLMSFRHCSVSAFQLSNFSL
jgi:hypothetical protein